MRWTRRSCSKGVTETMALLEIVEAPDPRLLTVCDPVERIDAGLLRLLDQMHETMRAAPGIGLAAPQVGCLRRACVIDLGNQADMEPLFLINPELTWSSAESVVEEEGCLSLPEQFGQVARAAEVRVRYRDRSGAPQEVAGEGLLARCLQHEIDHLNGVLFTEHLSALKRTLIFRKLNKAQRARSRANA
jgi:peptide deformylase